LVSDATTVSEDDLQGKGVHFDVVLNVGEHRSSPGDLRVRLPAVALSCFDPSHSRLHDERGILLFLSLLCILPTATTSMNGLFMDSEASLLYLYRDAGIY
jgi:hypothetical protein